MLLIKKILEIGIIILLLFSSISTGIFVNNFQIIPSKSNNVVINKKLLYPPEEVWNRTFGGVMHDNTKSILQTSDGGYIILGYTDSFGDGGDVWLIKTNSEGYEEWNKTFDGMGKFDFGTDIIKTSDGGFIICGQYSNMAGPPKDFLIDAWLIKLDSNFNEQWNKTFGGDNLETFKSIQQLDDKGYIILGETFNETSKNYIWLVKTDENGNEQWNKTYGNNGNAYGESLLLTSDGGFIIIGTKKTGPYNLDFWFLKLDENGNMLWNKTFGGSNWDWGLSVLETNDSDYFLVGRSGPFQESNDIWLIKTDENGNEQCNKTFGGEDDDGGESIIRTIDGDYLIIGYTSSFGAGDSDGWLIKIDGNGSELWNKTFGGIDDDRGKSIIQTIDGDYIIGGATDSFGAGFDDAWLIKLSHGIQPRYVYVDDNFDESTPGWGYDHFDKIQDGIDAVNENGSVFVFNGIYFENILVNKTINLIGENKNTTIIDGGGNYTVVYIEANWINISGFTIQNSEYWGIVLEWCKFNTISDNIISDNVYGLFLHHSHCNTITGNYIISNSYFGISLYQLCNNTIISNNKYNSNRYSSGANIIYNNFFDNARNAEDDWYNIWNITKTLGTNIIGGQWLGGNYWSDYTGDDLDGDGLGDTKLPYNNRLKKGGDWLPLTNQPPGITIINGTTSGKPGHTYSYTFIAVDPNGDDLLYYIDWGDNISEWTDFNSSGTDVIVKHKWSEKGTYNITAKAEDIYGVEGPEGKLTVTIPRTRATFNSLFLWFLERFPLLEKLLNLIR